MYKRTIKRLAETNCDVEKWGLIRSLSKALDAGNFTQWVVKNQTTGEVFEVGSVVSAFDYGFLHDADEAVRFLSIRDITLVGATWEHEGNKYVLGKVQTPVEIDEDEED